MNKMNKKGFTLIEMLVVIAIIAVLVSIVIPVVANSTTKAQAAADAANIRAAIATVTTNGLTGAGSTTTTVVVKSEDLDAEGTGISGSIGGIDASTFTKGTWTIAYNVTDGTVTATASTGG